VPLGLALATLYEVEHGSDTLVKGRVPKVSREAVARIFADTTRYLDEDQALEGIFSACSRGEYR
jgi:hypothetical protein